MQDTPVEPIRTLTYGLSRTDALAFTLLPHDLSRGEKFRLMVIIGVAGLLAGLLPEDMGAVAWWSAGAGIMAVGGVTAVAWMNVEVRRKAARMPIPTGEVTLAHWGDHLSERSGSGTRQVAMASIAQVIATDRHVFIRTDAAPVIIPAAAFEDAADMKSFADALDAARRNAEV